MPLSFFAFELLQIYKGFIQNLVSSGSRTPKLIFDSFVDIFFCVRLDDEEARVNRLGGHS